MPGIRVQVGPADGAQTAAVVGAEDLDRQLLGDHVTHPALEVDLVGDDVGLLVLVLTGGPGLPVPHVLDPARVHRQVGVRQAALARAEDVGAHLQREGEVLAHSRRRELRLHDVVGHPVLESAVVERRDLDRQRAPDLAGVVEPQGMQVESAHGLRPRSAGAAGGLRLQLVVRAAALETLAAAAHRGDELVEVHLEIAEHLVGVVLGPQPHLALALARVLHDLVRVLLGEPHDLGVGGELLGPLLGLGEHALGLLLGLGEHLLPLLDDPARLLDLLGDRGAHLVEDVVDLLAVDHDAVGERHGSCVVDDVVELVDENQDVHTQQPSLGSRLRAQHARRIDVRQTAGDGRGDQVGDGTPERGDLPDTTRAQEAVLGRGHHEDCFDVGRQLPIELRHGELVLEVGDGAQALEDDVRVPPAGELHDELVEAVDDDVVVPGERLAQEDLSLLRREQRRLALRDLDEADDDAAELGCAARDDVEVAHGHGVERARTDGGDVAGHQCADSPSAGDAASATRNVTRVSP